MPLLIANDHCTHSNESTIEQMMHRNTNVQAYEKNSLESKFSPYSIYHAGQVRMLLPIETVSEANGGKKRTTWNKGKRKIRGEYWTEAASRHKRQKGTVALYLRRHSEFLRLPCVINLTRYAPNKLDRWDNLPMSLKWVLDAICEELTGDYLPGRADSSELIVVQYNQILSQNYAVEVVLNFPDSLAS